MEMSYARHKKDSYLFLPTNAHIHTHTHTHTHTHIYIYIKILNYITSAPTCVGASAPFLGSFYIVFVQVEKLLKLLKLHKTVDRFMIKSVLLIKRCSGCICNSKVCNELI
jgi:hypothetical protein